jgi:hypothetical protein
MNFTAEHVELIVQRVLEHLGTSGSRAPSDTKSTGSPVPATTPKSVLISEPVVTQALLADATRGAKQIRIGPTAILTPSARDFVRNHGIEVVRESSSRSAATGLRWQVIATVSTPEVAAAVEGLKARGVSADFRLVGLPTEAASQAVSAVCRCEAVKVVVFTSQPELVACLANRNEQLRAATVSDAASSERTQRTLNPNLLTIDPSAKGVHELKALLKTFTLS